MNRRIIIGTVILLMIVIGGSFSFIRNNLKSKNDKDNWEYLVKVPEIYFGKARQGFESGNSEMASENLRIAAANIKTVAEDAPENEKVTLQIVVKRIEALADDIDNNVPMHKSRFYNTIAITDYELSDHYQRKALRAWVKNQSTRTGQTMKASTDYLESAGKWANLKLKESTVATIEESRKLSEKLTKNGDWASEEVNSLLQSLGKRIFVFKTRMDTRIKENEGRKREGEGDLPQKGTKQ